MSAPMPDFEMPEEASERRGRWLRLPRGPRARRVVGIVVVAAVLSALAIVGVPALVEQQRGREALAVAERYAEAVAEGDLEALVTALAPDPVEASDALLHDGVLKPAAPFEVDELELLALRGPRAIVRVQHTIGPDDGASIVELAHRSAEQRAACGDACAALGAETDVPPSLQWELDLASRSGTLTATITTMAPSATSEAMGPVTSTIVLFDVVLADDLSSLAVTPADPGTLP